VKRLNLTGVLCGWLVLACVVFAAGAAVPAERGRDCALAPASATRSKDFEKKFAGKGFAAASERLQERIMNLLRDNADTAPAAVLFGDLDRIARVLSWRGDQAYIADALYQLYKRGEITLASRGNSLWVGRSRAEEDSRCVESHTDATAIDRDEQHRPALDELVMSHTIREFWRVAPGSTPEGIQAHVDFFSGKKLIGHGWIDIDRTAASIMTCWLRSYAKGQLLAPEFAGRMFKRADVVSRLMGYNTPTAHVYYFLSRSEEREVEYCGARYWRYMNEERPEVKIFQRLGFTKARLRGKKHLDGYGGRYNERTKPLPELLALLDRNWVEWFYLERIRRVKGETLMESPGIDMNREEARFELERHAEEVFMDMLRQMTRVPGVAAGKVWERALELYPRSAALQLMSLAERTELERAGSPVSSETRAAGAVRGGMTPVDARRIFLQSQTVRFIEEGFNNHLSAHLVYSADSADPEIHDKIQKLIDRYKSACGRLRDVSDQVFTRTLFVVTSAGAIVPSSGTYGDHLIDEIGMSVITPETITALLQISAGVNEAYAELAMVLDRLALYTQQMRDGTIELALSAADEQEVIGELDEALRNARACLEQWAALEPEDVELELRKAGVLPPQNGDIDEIKLPPLRGPARRGGESVAGTELIGSSS